MSNREAFLQIHIVDPQGKTRAPGPHDRVILRDRLSSKEQPLHESYSDEKGFTFKLESSEIELSVQYDGFAELLQWFRAEVPSGEAKLRPFWPGTNRDLSADQTRDGYLLECIELSHATPGSAKTPAVYVARVTLHPTREYVAVIGTNYWEGALSGVAHPKRASLPFLDYAATYANHLYQSTVVNSSSPWTVFDCERGAQEVWMRVAGKGWRRQLARPEKAKQPAPAWPRPKDFVAWVQDIISGKGSASDYLGACDIYKYVSDTGAARPATVVELSIVSHAWAGGPILFNTFSGTGTTRLESDLDMRMIDFLPANSSSWQKLPDAFSPAARIHLWGCFATTLYNEMVIYLCRTQPDTEETFKWDKESIALTFTRPEVIKVLTDTVEFNCYMKQMAMYAKCPVYGGPPGYGSEWVNYGDLPGIPKHFKQGVKGRIMHIPATSRPLAKVRKLYESEEMGSRTFDEFGFMLYTP